MRYEVTKAKFMRCHEGDPKGAWEATLALDGKVIGHVVNDGWGGCLSFQISDAELKKLQAYCETLPNESEYNLKMDAELFVHELVDDYEEKRWMQRQSKTKTLFKLKGDKKGEWRTVKAPYSEGVQKYLDEKYGDKVEVVVK